MFLNRWVEKFWTRHIIRFVRIYGELAGANMTAIAKHLPAGRKIIWKVSRVHSFQAGRVWTFSCLITARSLSTTLRNRLKMTLFRATCLACCSFSDTKRFAIIIIGTARRLRPCEKQSALRFVFYFRFSWRGWMTKEAFFLCLDRLKE